MIETIHTLENTQELTDLLESMRNKIDTALLLIHIGKHHLVATQLEGIFEDSHTQIEGWCIKCELPHERSK